MPRADTNSRVAATLTLLEQIRESRDPLARARLLATTGSELDRAARAALADYRATSWPWPASSPRRQTVSWYPARQPIINPGSSQEGSKVSRAQTDAHAASTMAMIEMARDSQDPLRRAQILSDAQMQLAWTLRAAVAECQEAGQSWAAIGEAIGLPRETVFRQYTAGGPVIKAKPVQSRTSPGATDMHRTATEAVYAFKAEDGNWFGPFQALPAGEFTDGILRFESADPLTPFVGQVLTMRYGPWDHDVSVHACQVDLPGGQQRRVRVTHAVLDFLFGDGQTPLRQAMTALVNATQMNPHVDPRLRELIERAASAMVLETPTPQFIAAVRAVISQAHLAGTDEHVMIAMRRLERVVAEYGAWAAAASQ